MEPLSQVSQCGNCGVEIAPPKLKYCSKRCANYANGKRRFKEVSEKINAIKMELGCVRCGYKEHPTALQFNHINPAEKSFEISTSYNMNWDNLQKEIDKCEVLCANCHSIHSFNEGHSKLARLGNLRT